VFAEAAERGAADLHEAVELVGLVDAVRPLVHARVEVGVLVGQVAEVFGPGVVQDLVEGGLLIAARQDAVAVVDGDLVPIADTRGVGFGDIDGAVFAELFLRVRIIHDGDPAGGAVVVVVAQAEGVAHFVSCELADTGECGLIENLGLLVAGGVGREQSFEDHVVLAVAEGAKGDGGLDDLAGARIGDAAAHAPAAGGAVDPVDHVVADVHGVGGVGKDGDLEGVLEAGGFEGLIPPACAFDQGFLDVFGSAGIDPVLDGFDSLADGG
jgi:hypothetical protein